MSGEWFVLDGIVSEQVEDYMQLGYELLGPDHAEPEQVEEAPELVLPEPLPEEPTPKKAEYASWAACVTDGNTRFAPSPKMSSRAPEEPASRSRSPRERSPSPDVMGCSPKAWATSKWERKGRHQSFGHTLRAKRASAQVGPKATHVIAPAKGEATPLDELLLATTGGNLVPVQGALQHATAAQLAEELGGRCVQAKQGAAYQRQRSPRREAILAGYNVTQLDVPDAAGKMKRYTVCESQRASAFVKHPTCNAAAGRATKERPVPKKRACRGAWLRGDAEPLELAEAEA